MKIKLKNTKKINLENLLNRRSLSFDEFSKEYHITSFEILAKICKKLDVELPSKEFLDKHLFRDVEKPEEGIVVLASSEEEVFDANDHSDIASTTEYLNDITDTTEKKKKKRKKEEI